MPNQVDDLDRVFRCLSNSTRRAVIDRLASRPATMSELAERFDMALPSFLQHLDVLEDAGIVRSEKHGRVRTYHLCPPAILLADTWLDTQRKRWNTRLEQLDNVLNELNEKPKHE